MGQIFKLLRENYFEPRKLYPTKLLIKCEGIKNTFSNLKNLKKYPPLSGRYKLPWNE